MPADPLSPPPPEAPYFDPTAGAWVLSRYADVLAAFRELRLWPIGQRGEDQYSIRDDTGKLHVRGEMLDAVSPARVAPWQSQMEALAAGAIEQLPRDRPADLLAEFAQPWCLSLAILVTGADPADREKLEGLAREVFAGTGQPEDSPLRRRAAEATAELERIFHSQVARMGEPTMVGISQTLPRLLANSWVALLRHPAEWARLRQSPDLMPGAVEELLRYASIVPALFRRAVQHVELAGLRIRQGDQVHLMVASANRDPEQFPEPDRLDVTRRLTTHVTLGSGRNSCVGAMLIRMAAATTTAALLKGFPDASLADGVEWRSGSGFCWPSAVYVVRPN